MISSETSKTNYCLEIHTFLKPMRKVLINEQDNSYLWGGMTGLRIYWYFYSI